ncbi:MAG TPA: BON domain-containing protein [Terriglobales bacterium]|nr:BON domain-containing protein [Terriglobales bacterium]
MKAKFSLYSLLALLLALGISVGCTKARSDGDVATEIQGKIYADQAVQSKQITVQAADGVVTLAGNVSSDAERNAAATDAASVKGVKTVVNNLQVAPQQTAQDNAQAAPQEQAAQQEEAPKPRARGRARVHHTSARQESATQSEPDSNQMVSSAPAAPVNTAPVAPPPPPAPKKVTIPSGTTVTVRLIDPIDSDQVQPGSSFRATLDQPLSVDGEVAVPGRLRRHGTGRECIECGTFRGKVRAGA